LRILTFDWKFCSLWYCYQEGILIPNPYRNYPNQIFPLIFKFPTVRSQTSRMLLLTFLYFRYVAIHSKPVIMVLLPFSEFFIPPIYCYMLRIPELLFLTLHSFLAMTELFQTLYRGIATSFPDFSSPPCIATSWEFPKHYC
jgi:hypothetical protein